MNHAVNDIKKRIFATKKSGRLIFWLHNCMFGHVLAIDCKHRFDESEAFAPKPVAKQRQNTPYRNLELRVYCVFIGTLCCAPVGADAQDMVYQPVNPTFGGNPFNSSHLLGVANAQNDYTDPKKTGTSQSELFAQQLQSRLLSAFSSQITDAIFGKDARQSGTFTLGDQTVDFYRDLENVYVTITNNSSGEITKITVPLNIKVN